VQSPAEVGWDLGLYAQEWLEERFQLTRKLAAEVDDEPTVRAVHDLRVACRRLREAIAFFEMAPELPVLSNVDRAARRMARSVGRLRELDVTMKRMAGLEMPNAESDRLKREIVSKLHARRHKLADKRAKRIAKRTDQLETAIEKHVPLRVRQRVTDVDPANEAKLRAFTDARVSARRAEVERLVATTRWRGGVGYSERHAEHLHAIRVAIKHWRYASEIARPVVPRVLYRPIAVKLRHLQDLGGRSQDFADLANVVEKELGKLEKPSPASRVILAAVRTARDKAAIEFLEALRQLLSSAHVASVG
jgi:CHAD domain-containing protein